MNTFYENNITTSKKELSVLDKKINTNSLLRLALIIAGSVVLFQIFQLNNVWFLLVAVFAIVIMFSFLVRRQSALESLRDHKQAYLKVNENEVALQKGESSIYNEGNEYDDAKHPYVSDLDIFGSKSLFAKINRTATKDGESNLASWFLNPSSKDQITARQEAIGELASKVDWIQSLQTKLLFNLGKKINIKTFLERYLSDEGMNFGNSFMRIYVKLVPFLFLVGIIVSLFVLPIWNFLGILAIVHLIWSMALGGKVAFFSNRIDKVGATLLAYSDAVKMVEDEVFASSLNIALQKELSTENNGKLSIAFKNLGQLVDKLDARNNILVGAVLNMFLLWDFRQVLNIVKWKDNYKTDVLKTFDIIGEYESLLSLALLKYNNPNWCFPTILPNVDTDRIYANNLNHPLLPPSTAVFNNYDAIDHSLALITGSNMAGKSTFLRTVGINAVLAFAGSVVCASEFRLPIYKLISYMRIKDNLNESTSTFKAELDRMKFILQTVKSNKDSFVLIDEMLRGTNSVDKYLGSKAIIKQLIAMNGKGMVATHDLQLSTLEEEYKGILKNYHFDIQVINGEMLFDYKLKNGKCTIFNASLLLKGIGIDVEKA